MQQNLIGRDTQFPLSCGSNLVFVRGNQSEESGLKGRAGLRGRSYLYLPQVI